MKNKLIIGFFAFFALIQLTACDVEPIDPNIIVPDPENPADSGEFTVDIDGTTYTALTTQVLISNGTILLTATRANNDNFGFIIQGAAVGTYPANSNLLAFTQGGSEFGYWSINQANPTENTGSVTISSINTSNHTISGTFHFKGYWSDTTGPAMAPKEFTDGVFTDLPYQSQTTPTQNVFTAVVDGNDYAATSVQVNTTQGIVMVSATNGNGQVFTVSIDQDTAPGTFPLTAAGVMGDGAQVIYSNTADGGAINPGTMTITANSAGHVAGTFSGTATGTVNTATQFQIAEGHFDVTY